MTKKIPTTLCGCVGYGGTPNGTRLIDFCAKHASVDQLIADCDLAQTKLREIIAECPRPTKPYGKKIVTLAKEGLNGRN